MLSNDKFKFIKFEEFLKLQKSDNDFFYSRQDTYAKTPYFLIVRLPEHTHTYYIDLSSIADYFSPKLKRFGNIQRAVDFHPLIDENKWFFYLELSYNGEEDLGSGREGDIISVNVYYNLLTRQIEDGAQFKMLYTKVKSPWVKYRRQGNNLFDKITKLNDPDGTQEFLIGLSV